MVKTFSEYLKEQLEDEPIIENEGCGVYKKETEEEECERCRKIWGHESEEEEKEAAQESIKDEKDFRDYAKNKFQIVFGDRLDEDKMKKTIDGLLSDNKDLVDKGEWGELVGMLNKSFGA